ncbi:MAG TPA: acyl-CoA dehydrogenase family protein [Caulobacteraceae bacterium]
MNFEFSDEQKELGAQARRFLDAKSPTAAARAVLEGPQSYDAALWKGLGEMGFLGVVIPEEYGGLGLGYLELCVIAEEMGRAIAPVPFSSSVFLATEFLLASGSEAQKAAWLPKLASGEAIGTFAYAEAVGGVSPRSIQVAFAGGKLTGAKLAVPDGDIADFAVVAVRTAAGQDERGVCLALVDLKAAGVTRTVIETIDPTRSHANIAFDGAPAELLGGAGEGWRIISQVFDHAAVLTAFEQIGGADRALEMARDYALERMAFGRPIGSFQAIKHMLADMYVSATLARSNGYYGAWALSTGAAELPEAAASCRVAATQAFQHCAKNNIQVHGGMGFTWAFDCHLFYRRSNLLAVNLGSLSQWEDALIQRMRARNTAAA